MKVLMTPIQVCAIWNIEGTIRPIAFCIEEGDEKIKVSIDSIIRQSEEKIVGRPIMNFACYTTWKNRQRMVNIRYDMTYRRWYLYAA